MSETDILEILLRGAAMGMTLLIAVAFFRLCGRSQAARFGALFALSAAVYIPLASPLIADSLGLAALPLGYFANLEVVFFWWFALALFCDDFRWKSWRLAPFVLVAAFLALERVAGLPPDMRVAAGLGCRTIALILMIHVLIIALKDWGDDLVEPRRKFRVLASTVIALVSGVTVTLEMWVVFAPKPDGLHMLQAVAFFVTAAGVGGWLLLARRHLLPTESRRPAVVSVQTGARPGVAPEDRALLDRLIAFMEAGGFAESGLTVRNLAERLNTQEHRLRAVINQGLGYRNFAAFLNRYRVDAAKAALSDPGQARRQVLQIALDLGYGSIAPFNRAFRDATGETPTGYRKAALADGTALAPPASSQAPAH